MVYCRTCGKNLAESAPTCPHCGGVQPGVANPSGPRSIAKLIAFGVLWTFLIWSGGIVLVGAIAGGLDPANAEQAGGEWGEKMSVPFLILAIILAAVLTTMGVLPGTKKGKP